MDSSKLVQSHGKSKNQEAKVRSC